MIHVEIVKPSINGLNAFIQLPFDIYHDDPNWVPPSRHVLLNSLLGRDNEMFAKGIHRFFLAFDDEKPVARVLAGIDLRHNARVGQPEGYLSLLESYDNLEYLRAVLDAAITFLREHGVKRVFGPIAPRYDLLNRGLLVEGFDGPPVLENPYNQPWLPSLIEQYGFTKERDLFAYMVKIDEIPVERIKPMAERIQRRFGFRVEHIDFSRDNLARVAQDLSMVICDATPDEHGSYLPTPEDLLYLFKRIRPFLRNELAVIAYAGQQAIGCMVGFLDSSPSLQGTSGRRTPWNWLKTMLRSKKMSTVRCPIQYVVQEYQNKAVNAVMLAEAVEGAKRLGITRFEGSTVDETHIVSVNNTQMAGGKKYRVYRIYQLIL